jgi:hypothetical protein
MTNGRRAPHRRIKYESEPLNLPPETNASFVAFDAFDAADPASPVRYREAAFANTPRIRGVFSDRVRALTQSLRTHRPNGGGWSLERTRLCGQFPDLWEDYREVLRYLSSQFDPSRKFPAFSQPQSNDNDEHAHSMRVRAHDFECSYPCLRTMVRSLAGEETRRGS